MTLFYDNAASHNNHAPTALQAAGFQTLHQSRTHLKYRLFPMSLWSLAPDWPGWIPESTVPISATVSFTGFSGLVWQQRFWHALYWCFSYFVPRLHRRMPRSPGCPPRRRWLCCRRLRGGFCFIRLISGLGCKELHSGLDGRNENTHARWIFFHMAVVAVPLTPECASQRNQADY